MDERQIRISYKYAKDPEAQIEILAQLNECKPSRIRKLLTGKEYATRQEQVERLYSEGISVAQLAKQFGLTQGSVRTYIGNVRSARREGV